MFRHHYSDIVQLTWSCGDMTMTSEIYPIDLYDLQLLHPELHGDDSFFPYCVCVWTVNLKMKIWYLYQKMYPSRCWYWMSSLVEQFVCRWRRLMTGVVALLESTQKVTRQYIMNGERMLCPLVHTHNTRVQYSLQEWKTIFSCERSISFSNQFQKYTLMSQTFLPGPFQCQISEDWLLPYVHHGYISDTPNKHM